MIKSLNKYRRKMMPLITKDIGKNHFKKRVKGKIKDKSIHTILVCRPNQRLGNILLITPLVQELTRIFPNSKIDVIVKGTIANQILKNYKNIDNIIVLPRKPYKELINYFKIFLSVKSKRYDLVINAEKGSSSGKILTLITNSKFKIFQKLECQPIIKGATHLAKNSIHNLWYYLKILDVNYNNGNIPNMSINLTKNEILKGKTTLNKIIPDKERDTISIFTYATGKKCYSKDWWSNFYNILDKKFSKSYNIIEILPIENVSQIDYKAKFFYSKDIREISSVIYNTRIFIGADSGIMHLASASETTTIGLFSITDENKYKPYGNNSLAINTNRVSTKGIIDIINNLLNQNLS